jgi:hypothetical protein
MLVSKRLMSHMVPPTEILLHQRHVLLCILYMQWKAQERHAAILKWAFRNALLGFETSRLVYWQSKIA